MLEGTVAVCCAGHMRACAPHLPTMAYKRIAIMGWADCCLSDEAAQKACESVMNCSQLVCVPWRITQACSAAWPWASTLMPENDVSRLLTDSQCPGSVPQVSARVACSSFPSWQATRMSHGHQAPASSVSQREWYYTTGPHALAHFG